MKLIILLIFILAPFCGSAQTNINIGDFGVISGNDDATPGLQKALEACKQCEKPTLIFPKGVYHFYPDFGVDKYCFISNNDEGLKRIIFPLFDFKDLTIDGQGSSFIFHGFVNPFVIDHSSNVTLRGFSIDSHRSFHSEAIILANREDGIDVEIPESFPFEINNGILVFIDDPSEQESLTTIGDKATYPYCTLLEFDTEKREIAHLAKDHYVGENPCVVESLGKRAVRIFNKELSGKPGNTLVFGANRNYPGFVVSDCSNITFQEVTIYHSGGMGIIGQRTHNITVDHCRVTPSPGRMISCVADATHFVNCTGKIELSYNLFENQFDDATNIHGIYVQIARKISPNEVIVQLKHKQQLGFDFLKEGLEIEFVKGLSLIPKGRSKVIEAERINKSLTRVKFLTELPYEIEVGDVVAEVRDYPFIHIHHNIIRNNRSRGMLLNCRGKTVVENNYFHTPAAALLFEGDAQYWFEQGGVSDCIIRDNVFDNCLFPGSWGDAVIGVRAGIEEDFEESRYNKNIRITGNTFRIFDDAHLLDLYCVDRLIWKNNKVEKTDDYPKVRGKMDRFQVKYSKNIKIIE
ncbi:MAG: right-handed parallel beta-helix repeat-containing protein [Bacteroidia bacterium]|nr:right-handed parallel beta-helix repeat-containing protein [Bacteroidia bacterium]